MKNYEKVNYCEFDSYATKSYCAIHNVDESLNLGDITKVDETKIKPFNMIVGGSPCQDFSIAGKQKGAMWKCKKCGHEYNPLTVHWSKRFECPECQSDELDKSRSSLLVEWLRIIRGNKPNFGIYENVKNIVGKEFKETTFKIFEEELQEYGYNTYWKVLNAKDYGIPQNRERVYLILIKKDLDNGKFKFPKAFDNGIRLKDILETEVEEKFYLKDEVTEKFLKLNPQDNIISKDNGFVVAGSLKGCMDSFNNSFSTIAQVYKDDSICPTLDTMQGGYRQPKIIEDFYLCRAAREYENYSPTLRSERTGLKVIENSNSRIRKLTPKECFRLMGFSDEDFEKARSSGMSNSQLYKQSGNSIVTDVPYYILLEIYKVMPYLFDDLKLSSFFSGIGAFEIALDRLYEYINNNENFQKPQVN